MKSLSKLFVAMSARDEAGVFVEVSELFTKGFSVKDKADVKSAMSGVTGAGKAFANAADADDAYSWFLDLKEIKYFNMRLKKDLPVSVESIRSEVWPILQFIETEGYPFNREVEIRSKKKNHLNGGMESGTQLTVAVIRVSVDRAPKLWAELTQDPDVDGYKVCKIDGHSRTESWVNGRLEAPEKLKVDIYESPTDEQVEKLYVAFNSPATAETGKERTQHINKACHFKPKSKYVSGQWKTAFEKCGLGLTHDAETICKLAPALMAIDGWDVPIVKGSNFLKNGVKRAIIHSLVTIDDDGEIKSVASEPSEFWKHVLTSQVEIPEVSRLKTLLSRHSAESDQQVSATDCFNRYAQLVSSTKQEVE